MVMGPLLEPLNVAIHAFRRAGLNSKSRPKVLIFGAGTIGLCCAAICKFNEANMTAVVDINDERVNFARSNGFATECLTIPKSEGGTTEEGLDHAKAVAQMTCKLQSRVSEGYDVVFECTGAESCSQAAVYVRCSNRFAIPRELTKIQATRPGGRVVLVGMGSPTQTLPVSAAALREVDIVGTFRYANTYTPALELLSKPWAGLPGLQTLITHSFHGLDMVRSAFEIASKSHDDSGRMVLKTIITLDEGDEKG